MLPVFFFRRDLTIILIGHMLVPLRFLFRHLSGLSCPVQIIITRAVGI